MDQDIRRDEKTGHIRRFWAAGVLKTKTSKSSPGEGGEDPW